MLKLRAFTIVFDKSAYSSNPMMIAEITTCIHTYLPPMAVPVSKEKCRRNQISVKIMTVATSGVRYCAQAKYDSFRDANNSPSGSEMGSITITLATNIQPRTKHTLKSYLLLRIVYPVTKMLRAIRSICQPLVSQNKRESKRI